MWWSTMKHRTTLGAFVWGCSWVNNHGIAVAITSISQDITWYNPFSLRPYTYAKRLRHISSIHYEKCSWVLVMSFTSRHSRCKSTRPSQWPVCGCMVNQPWSNRAAIRMATSHVWYMRPHHWLMIIRLKLVVKLVGDKKPLIETKLS